MSNNILNGGRAFILDVGEMIVSSAHRPTGLAILARSFPTDRGLSGHDDRDGSLSESSDSNTARDCHEALRPAGTLLLAREACLGWVAQT